jgi:mannitol 2-dehydrogenase
MRSSSNNALNPESCNELGGEIVVAEALRAAKLGTFLARGVKIPSYNRKDVKRGILHLSVGNFHRAHQCVYLDQLFEQGKGFEFGIVGAGLLDIDRHVSEAMLKQDCLFTVTERSADSTTTKIIGSMIDYVAGFQNWNSLLKLIEGPEIKIISLTITESGYYVDKETGKLQEDHPAIKHDLNLSLNQLKDSPLLGPKTAYGLLFLGLKNRISAGHKVTLLSCDNLQGNGDVLKRGLISFVELLDAKLAGEIERLVSFPNCMVDRITPRATENDSQQLKENYGVIDDIPVVCEDYIQWVVEDKFCAGRPELECVGVQFTDDVKPYEKMKIRLLNAGHSSMGYIGYLLGYKFINEIAVDPDCVRFTRYFMDVEATPTLDKLPGVDFSEYKDSLIRRFANPYLKDQTLRICSDGSGKISGFVLPTLRDCLSKGLSISAASFLVASWIRFLSGKDEKGEAILIEDPLGAKLSKLSQEGGHDPRKVLSESTVFGELGQDEVFYSSVKRYLTEIYQRGSRAALRAFNEGTLR